MMKENRRPQIRSAALHHKQLEVDRERQINRRLIKALEFYADEENYQSEGAPGKWFETDATESFCYGTPVETLEFEPDNGEHAREALGKLRRSEDAIPS